jgi:hypothetical protein
MATQDDSDDSPRQDTAESKKKPGRPRKKPLRSTAVRAGISPVAKKDDNHVELIYDEPMMFKRVFGIFKAAAAGQLNWVFDTREVRIFASDHMQKSDILVTFDCAKMTHYFCAGHIVMTLDAQYVERINQMLDKNHTHVNIVVKKSGIRSAIMFVFQNEMKIDEIREIKTDPPSQYQFSPVEFDGTTHAISFELPSKFLKKFVADTSVLSDRLTVRKVGAAGPLTFLYSSKDNKVDAKHIVKDAQGIKLMAATSGDAIFSVTILLDYIKPFATSLLAETAMLFVDGTKKMLLISELDNASITVKVTAEIEKF